MEHYLQIIQGSSKKRLSRLRKALKFHDLSFLLLFDGDPIGTKISCTKHYNVVVISADGDPLILADRTLHDVAVEESLWDVVLIEDFSLECIVNKLKRIMNKWRDLRIGVNKSWGRTRISFIYVDVLNALAKEGFRVEDATPILTQVFDKPFSEELEIIEWISKVCSIALEEVYESLRPGLREYEIAKVVDKVLNENGIIDRVFPTIVASGYRAAAPHAHTSFKRIEHGEPVIVDMGPLWLGYDGCVAYTFIAGRGKKWEEIMGIVEEAIEEGLKYVRPGTPVKLLDIIPRKVIREHGLPDYYHLTGHPIGGFYKPVITEFVEYSLEEDMVFAYEPAVYIPGEGGVRIEHHILVASNEGKMLTKAPKLY